MTDNSNTRPDGQPEIEWAIEVFQKTTGRTEIIHKASEESARRSFLDAQRRGVEGLALLNREVGPWRDVEVDQ